MLAAEFAPEAVEAAPVLCRSARRAISSMNGLATEPRGYRALPGGVDVIVLLAAAASRASRRPEACLGPAGGRPAGLPRAGLQGAAGL